MIHPRKCSRRCLAWSSLGCFVEGGIGGGLACREGQSCRSTGAVAGVEVEAPQVLGAASVTGMPSEGTQAVAVSRIDPLGCRWGHAGLWEAPRQWQAGGDLRLGPEPVSGEALTMVQEEVSVHRGRGGKSGCGGVPPGCRGRGGPGGGAVPDGGWPGVTRRHSGGVLVAPAAMPHLQWPCGVLHPNLRPRHRQAPFGGPRREMEAAIVADPDAALLLRVQEGFARCVGEEKASR